MKITAKTILAVSVLLVCGIAVWLSTFDSIEKSTTSQVMVTKKYEENGEYWIQGHNPHMEQKQEITMSIPDRNVWRLLNEQQMYVMTYFYKKKMTHPVFEEIVPESK